KEKSRKGFESFRDFLVLESAYLFVFELRDNFSVLTSKILSFLCIWNPDLHHYYVSLLFLHPLQVCQFPDLLFDLKCFRSKKKMIPSNRCLAMNRVFFVLLFFHLIFAEIQILSANPVAGLVGCCYWIDRAFADFVANPGSDFFDLA